MDKSDPLPHKTAASVVTEIQACVSSDPSRLSRVIEVLRGHELCRGVAEKISCMVTNGGKGTKGTEKLNNLFNKGRM